MVVDTRCALGRTAKIGDLYDIRNDTFTGKCLFTYDTLPTDIHTVFRDSTEDRVEYQGQLKNKLKGLQVEDDLQLSTVAGLARAEGDLRSLMCHQVSPTSGIMFRTVKTAIERLVTPSHNIQKLFEMHGANTGTATHVVVGISWGGVAAVCIENKNSETQVDDMEK